MTPGIVNYRVLWLCGVKHEVRVCTIHDNDKNNIGNLVFSAELYTLSTSFANHSTRPMVLECYKESFSRHIRTSRSNSDERAHNTYTTEKNITIYNNCTCIVFLRSEKCHIVCSSTQSKEALSSRSRTVKHPKV